MCGIILLLLSLLLLLYGIYRRTIHELRRMYGGAVPLAKQEKFTDAMVRLQEDKDNFCRQLKQVMFIIMMSVSLVALGSCNYVM